MYKTQRRNSLVSWLLGALAVFFSPNYASAQFPSFPPNTVLDGNVVVPMDTSWYFGWHDSDGSHNLGILLTTNLTADRTLSLDTGDSDRLLTISGDADISGTNTGDVTLAGQDYLSIVNQVITANLIDLSDNTTGTLTVPSGGTGSTTFTDGGVLLGSGTGPITALGVLANGEILIGDGITDPVPLAAFTSSTGTLKHESGGLEADVSAFAGLLAVIGGATSEVNTSSQLAAILVDETGGNLAVFSTSPVLRLPEIDDTSFDHQYVFAVSELTADRFVKLPLLTGNDAFVFESHVATLTNKTIDGDDNTLLDIDGSSIVPNTITTTELAATLAFADGDLLDLALILHNDVALQGLRLPQVGGAPTNVVSGEGFLGWNQTGNVLLVYDGTAWVPTGVQKLGTPLNDQLAVWTNANDLEGDPGLTFDGARLTTLSATITQTADAESLTVSLTAASATADVMSLTNVATGSGDSLNIQHNEASGAALRIAGGTIVQESTTGPDNFSLLAYTLDGSFAGVFGISSGTAGTPVGSPFMARTDDGIFDENDGAFVAGPGFTALFGASTLINGLTGTTNRQVWVDSSGTLYPVEPPPPGWQETDVSVANYDLGAGTGVGAWVEMTDLIITLPATYVVGERVNIQAVVQVVNKTTNRNGTIEIAFGVNGADPTTAGATHTIAPGFNSVTVTSITVAAASFAISDTISVFGRRTFGNNVQFGVDFDGAQRAGHDLDVHNGGDSGATNFLGLTDTPPAYPTAGLSRGIVVNSAGTGLVFVTASQILSETKPSGLFDGGELNIGPGADDIEVIAGAGVIFDSYTDPLDIPSIVKLSWNQINVGIVGTPASSPTKRWFTIRPVAGSPAGPVAGTDLGELKQYTDVPTSPEFRDEIFLGSAIWNGTVWQEVSSPIVVNSAAHMLYDIAMNVFGPTFTIDGGVISEQVGFMLDRTAGTVWETNRNWHVDKRTPNRETFLAETPLSFRYITSDLAVVGALVTVVDPSQYENPLGTVVGVPGGANTSTIQRLYIDSADNVWVLWGQTTYSNFDDALAAIGSDTVDATIPDFLGDDSQLLGFIVSSMSAPDWNGVAAFVSPVEVGGGGGGSGGTTNWDEIGNPVGDGSIAMAATVQTMDWDSPDTAVLTKSMTFSFSHDSTTDITSQTGLTIERLSTTGNATFETLLHVHNDDVDGLVDTAILVESEAGLITTAINVSDPQITNALSIGTNNILTGATTIASTELDLLDGKTKLADVVGTPVNNQIGVWTGDGTIEGALPLTFDGEQLFVDSTGVGTALRVRANSSNTSNGTVDIDANGVTTGILVAVRSSSLNMSSGSMMLMAELSNGAIVNRSNDSVQLSTTRTNTATTGTVTDTHNTVRIVHKSTQNGVGGTYNVSGSALELEVSVANAAGSVTSTTSALKIVHSFFSDGDGVDIVMGGGSGNAISTNVGFSVDNAGALTSPSLTPAGNFTFQGAVDSTTGWQFLDADGGDPIINIDTTNERVAIGPVAPARLFHISEASSGSGSNANAVMVIESADATMDIGMVGANNSQQRLTFADAASSVSGIIAYRHNGDQMRFNVGGSTIATLATTGLLIGTTVEPTANATKVLALGNNGATDPTMGANTAGLFAKDDVGTVQLFAINSNSTVTQISPHHPVTKKWHFWTYDPHAREVYHVPDMERVVSLLEKLTGEELSRRIKIPSGSDPYAYSLGL